jgi:DNA-binding transcriptional ArsR family regulator
MFTSTRILFVRYTLSNISNTTPVMTVPKTKTSHAWVSLSSRVIDALEHQTRRQASGRVQPDLVFCRPDGRPLRPEYVLRHFHQLSDAAGLPRNRLHDLRHLAATLMISSQVPLAMVSKTLRHSKLSITVDTYGHLVPSAAQPAHPARRVREPLPAQLPIGSAPVPPISRFRPAADGSRPLPGPPAASPSDERDPRLPTSPSGEYEAAITAAADRVFFALSDATRRRLLDHLYVRDGQRLSELAAQFDISRQAIKKHLDVLEGAGVVVTRRSHRGTRHFLSRGPIRQVHARWMEKFTRLRPGVDCG